MKGTVFHGPRDVRVERFEDPSLKTPEDAIVRITRAAICGSDLHFYHGAFPIEPGFVLGHEGVGVIEEVGRYVGRLKKGQRVVVSGLVACGGCFFCRRGQPSQCAESGSAVFGYGKASAGKLGWLGGEQSEAVRVPMADYTCYPLSDAIDDDAAVFLADILPTSFFGAVNGNIRPGDTVAIFGCGPVGLCAIMSAKLFGPAEVIAVDSIAYRLELARKLGAYPVNLGEAQATILARTEGRGADVAIAAVGNEGALNATIMSVRGGGTVSVIGAFGAPSFNFPIGHAFGRDLTFRIGLANINAHIPELARLIERGALDPRPLISHVLPLDQAAKGYEIFDARTDNVMKVLLKP
ncbi:MAG: alcohol dehydrogenase catalytic domain-containing protein [Candidatus Binatus sp.]|uniref:alcohol dehydrogenase catalytic domain-containing protein n=1 Tax=Candidatus Binatus sp. TaxID=2811406 RepID=UPI0027221052|nr:alcohol dehydrogenase catalytic domain-containing protein [Candidatus Binatus sp.]MDO8431230.1 alcohol dehydrogenase catalytic domain-containing protein [Candidatus Binatus sp.]